MRVRCTRKAQAAMEYIVTYGWAILVILFVGIVLWQMGLFTSRTDTTSSNGFSKIKPQLAGLGLSTKGVFNAVFTNGMGNKIIVKGMKITNRNGGALICCSNVNYDPTNCNALVNGKNTAVTFGNTATSFGSLNGGAYPRIQAGDSFPVVLGVSGFPAASCVIPGAQSGQPYNIDVEIAYEDASRSQTVPHVDDGTIKGTFE